VPARSGCTRRSALGRHPCPDWKQQGAALISDVRNVHPAIYLRMVASLVSREQPIPAQSEFGGYTYAELIETLKAEVAAFEREDGESTETNTARPCSSKANRN
jgi:hypothetical protein